MKTLPVGEPVDLQERNLASVTLRVMVYVVYGEEVLERYFDRIVEISDLLQDAVSMINIGATRLSFYSYFPTKANETVSSFNKAWKSFNLFLFREYEEGRLESGDGLFFATMEQLKTHALEIAEKEV